MMGKTNKSLTNMLAPPQLLPTLPGREDCLGLLELMVEKSPSAINIFVRNAGIEIISENLGHAHLTHESLAAWLHSLY
jgi:hypothetical protein